MALGGAFLGGGTLARGESLVGDAAKSPSQVLFRAFNPEDPVSINPVLPEIVFGRPLLATVRHCMVFNGAGNPEISYPVPAGADCRPGLRPVRNLLAGSGYSSEDFSGWQKAAGMVDGGVISGVGPNGEDAHQFDFSNVVSFGGITANGINTLEGDQVISQWLIRTIGAESTIRFNIAGVTTTAVPISTDWAKLESPLVTVLVDDANANLLLMNNSEGTLGIIQIVRCMPENVVGFSTQTSSEYIDSVTVQDSSGVVGFKWFDTESENGPKITTGRGLQITAGYSQYLTVTTDYSATENPSLSAGKYTCWLEGAGSVVLTGSTSGALGTVTENNPVKFTLAGAETVAHVATGQIDLINTTNTPVSMPFSDLSVVAADYPRIIATADSPMDPDEGTIKLRLRMRVSSADFSPTGWMYYLWQGAPARFLFLNGDIFTAYDNTTLIVCPFVSWDFDDETEYTLTYSKANNYIRAKIENLTQATSGLSPEQPFSGFDLSGGDLQIGDLQTRFSIFSNLVSATVYSQSEVLS